MKIFLRAGKSPIDSFNPVVTLENNVLGTNSGNHLFSHAVYKHLSLPGTTIKTGRYGGNLQNAAKINSNYDVFVVPLANAFRPSYLGRLEKLAELIEHLTIPVVVVGVGAQTDANYDLEKMRPLDAVVTRFAKAVLDRSASIGVRGECTAAYLRHLGFKDVDIIGCPSMFYYGSQFKIRPAGTLDRNSRIAINISAAGKQAAFSDQLGNMGAIFDRNVDEFPDLTYVAQENRSLETLIYGRSKDPGVEHGELSPRVADYLFREGRVRMYTEPVTWFRSLSKYDFVTGSRLHGCVAGLIGGTPAHMFAHDSRTLEIARLFNIPHTLLNQKATGVRFDEALAGGDYGLLERTHALRLDDYARFLEKNGLKHMVHDEQAMDAFDQEVDRHPRIGEVRPLAMDLEDVTARFEWQREGFALREAKLVKKIRKLEGASKARSAAGA